MPLPHGEHRLLKVKYPATMPPLPLGLSGNTFETVFGTQQSMLELFILKRKIKGPCWLTITNPIKVSQIEQRRSWSKHEIRVENPKHVECTLDDLNRSSPPLVSLTVSIKTTRSQHNTNEIALISCIV
jgi:DNA polymerase alpha subunit A